MSCFDTVVVKCPNCGSEVGFQSKAGPCNLDDFKSDAVPSVIAEDVDGDMKPCWKCDKTLKIYIPPSVSRVIEMKVELV